MKPAAFTYHRPATLEAALALLDQLGPEAKPLAGGQSLGPMLNMRLATPAHLVDLNDLTEFSRIREVGDEVELGFLVRHHQVAESALLGQHCPLLPQVAQTIGHYAIRQRGTLGGSLVHADPAAQLALAAVTLGARVTLASAQGRRELSAQEFFLAAMTTALAPNEMLVSVRFPKFAPGERSAYRMFNRRHGDYALVAVCATVTVREGLVSRLRLGISGAAPVPQRLDALARAFEGAAPGTSWIASVADAVSQAIQPEDDRRVSPAYRRDLARDLTARALCRALDRMERVAA